MTRRCRRCRRCRRNRADCPMWWVTLPLAEEALGQVCRGVKALIECSKLQVHKVDDPNKQFVQFVMG